MARQWNEVLLASIHDDFARARNLTSIALYDAWAVYSDGPEQTYLLDKTVGSFTCSFSGVPRPDDVEAAQREAMSYAASRLLRFRFRLSPGWILSFSQINRLISELGYSATFHSTDYTDGNPVRGLGQLHRPRPDRFWDAGRSQRAQYLLRQLRQPLLHALQFSLRSDSVYTIAGQQVAILVRGIRAAGRYRLTWDGRNDAGGILASGMYLYRLRIGTPVETRKMRKMLLLR